MIFEPQKASPRQQKPGTYLTKTAPVLTPEPRYVPKRALRFVKAFRNAFSRLKPRTPAGRALGEHTMKPVYVVHHPAAESDCLSVVDSVWTDHEAAKRRVGWLVAEGGEATIATRFTDDGDLELGDAGDAIPAKRETPERIKAGNPAAAKLKPAPALAKDMEMFEAVLHALLNSDLETECWEPGGAPGFAVLWIRIAEQTVAEFGGTAARGAFAAIAELIEPTTASLKARKR